ncbi:Choline/Carnitine O-acyltransferase [Cooperia oncophora]
MFPSLQIKLRRQPLLIYSSVAHTDFLEVPEHRRATWAYTAARVTYYEGMSQLAVDRQAVKPLGSGLLCSTHYDKLYSVCRVPGEETDELVNYGISKHIVAIYGGCFYKVMMCDEKNRMYSIEELTKIFAELFARKENVTGSASKVAALTAARRNPTNAASLREIESAAFILTLDDAEYFNDPADPDTMSNFLKNMLTGNGANRWADKSLNYVVAKNSRCGGTSEHSVADGAEFDHIMENFSAFEFLTPYPTLEEQRQIERITEKDRGLTLAIHLPIEVNTEMAFAIERSYSEYSKLRDDVDVAATLFR